MLLFFFVIFHGLMLLPSLGYTAYFYKNHKKQVLLSIVIAYILGLVVFGSIASIAYILKAPNLAARTILTIYVVAGLVFLFKTKAHLLMLRAWLPIGSVVLASLFATIFVSMPLQAGYRILPDPSPQENRNYDTLSVKVINISQTPANDNYIPYRQAQFMVNKSNAQNDSFIVEWGVHFFQRTPLMGAVTAGYFILLGDTVPASYTWDNATSDTDHTYLQFQVISHILNSLYLLPLFLLVTRLFSRRTAILTSLFLIPSFFFLYNAIFSWPKSLTAFFVLSAYFLLLKRSRKSVITAGLVSGLGYLSHDLAVLYIGSGFIFLLLERRYLHALLFGIVPSFFALPWILLPKLLFGRPSSFILYPFSIHDIPQPSQSDSIMREFFATPVIRLIKIRLESLQFLLTPYQLLYSEGGQTLQRRIWASSIFSVPGSIGYTLLLPAVIGLWKKVIGYKYLILIFGPIVFSVIVIGWPRGLGSLHFAEGSVALLTAIGVSSVEKYKKGRLLLPIYLFGQLQLYLVALFGYSFMIESWFASWTSILKLLVMGCILVICAIGISQIEKLEKRQKALSVI